MELKVLQFLGMDYIFNYLENVIEGILADQENLDLDEMEIEVVPI